MATSSLAETALAYALSGTAVFPLTPREKYPLGGAAPNGFKDATTDPERVKHWWTQYPDANIGVTGVDVLDVDKPKHPNQRSGFLAFQLLREHTFLVGAERIVITQSGSLHIYFAPTDQPNASGIGGYSLDFRGAHHGYVVAPPSIGKEGEYKLHKVNEGPVGTFDLMAAREFLSPPPKELAAVRRCTLPKDKRRQFEGLVRFLDSLTSADAGIHDKVLWACCRACEAGFGDEQIGVVRHAAILALNTTRPERPAEREVDGALDWARKEYR
jgi:hypothetical protein